MKDPDVRVLYFANGAKGDWMRLAIGAAKSIVVESPQSLSLDELERLAKDATECQQVAAIYEPRRWETDFLQAQSVVQSDRLGKLLRARYSVLDYRIPGETFSFGIAKELGSRILDQLLMFVGPKQVTSSLWRHFPSASDGSDGFLASFEFADEILATIEIQTRSLLSLSSGWMLEGIDGAYRNGRLYTRTSDGEIVDESLPLPNVSSDPFFDALIAALRGINNDLPTVRDATRVATLLTGSDIRRD